MCQNQPIHEKGWFVRENDCEQSKYNDKNYYSIHVHVNSIPSNSPYLIKLCKLLKARHASSLWVFWAPILLLLLFSEVLSNKQTNKQTNAILAIISYSSKE